MNNDMQKRINGLILGEEIDKYGDFYCESRDLFQARLDRMLAFLLLNKDINEDDVYVVSAIAGEIGNNSFDHNLGSWVGKMGVFFAYEYADNNLSIVLADAGQGIFNTLKRVKPEIKNDAEALEVAFNEKISGRAPEARGNGLKFVKENVKNRSMHLDFYSGRAKAEMNAFEKIFATAENYQGCLAIINLKSK